MYNREIFKNIINQNRKLAALNFNVDNWNNNNTEWLFVSPWMQFCAYYPEYLPLKRANINDNIVKFLIILEENAFLIDLFNQKHLLLQNLIDRKNFMNKVSVTQEHSSNSNGGVNSVTNTTNTNTANNSISSADSRQNADNLITFERDTPLNLVDNFSKQYITDSQTQKTDNIVNSQQSNTITTRNNDVTLTGVEADAVIKALSFEIPTIIKRFWLSFKPLFNYRVKYVEPKEQ